MAQLVEVLRRLPQRPLLGIVLVDLVPLVGVVALGWDLRLVLLLFWLENVAVGFYGIVKMAIIARLAALLLVPFFLVHFGMFTAVHFVFVVVLFVADETGIGSVWAFFRHNAWVFAVAGSSLMVSHGISFRDNFLRRESTELNPLNVMGQAYRRVALLHVTIVLGAVPVVVLGEPRWALALLTLLKLGADLGSHAFEHRHAIGWRPVRPGGAGRPSP